MDAHPSLYMKTDGWHWDGMQKPLTQPSSLGWSILGLTSTHRHPTQRPRRLLGLGEQSEVVAAAVGRRL